MKFSKPFWMKLIVFVVICMVTITEILPTQCYQTVVYADDLAEADGDTAGVFENIISKIVLLVFTGIYALFSLAVGQNMTIEDIIFNNYTNTKLSIFQRDVGKIGRNDFIEKSGIREPFNLLFKFFRALAIMVYMIILVYMGIKILLSSTGAKKAKYKELLLYWVEGILILFIFPYVIRYMILFNDAFVSFIRENKDHLITSGYFGQLTLPQSPQNTGDLSALKTVTERVRDFFMGGTDYMSIIYKEAWQKGWFLYVVVWIVMFFQTIGFLIAYFRRLLMALFLIAIFPLVMISYSLDRIRDKKAQAFERWLEEYAMVVFNQCFHAIGYVLIMSFIATIIGDGSVQDYWLLILIAIGFLSKVDDILREIFKLKGSAGTLRSVGQSLAGAAVYAKAARSITGVGTAVKGGVIGTIAKVGGRAADLGWNIYGNQVNQTKARLDAEEAEARHDAYADAEDQEIENSATVEQYKNDIQDAVKLVLSNDKNVKPEDIEKAVKKILAYRKMTNNKNATQARNEVRAELSDEEKKQLEELLLLYQSVDKLQNGSVNVNVKNLIDLSVSCLHRDANGNLTPASQAIANKITANAGALIGASRVMRVKFNRDPNAVKRERKNANPLSPRGRFAVRGREAAKAAKRGTTSSGTLLEKTRRAQERFKGAGKNPGQGRASEKYQKQNYSKTARGRFEAQRRYTLYGWKLANKNKKKKTYENVTSMDGTPANIHSYRKPGQARRLRAVKNPRIIYSRAEKKNTNRSEFLAKYISLDDESANRSAIPTGTSFGDSKPQTYRVLGKASKGKMNTWTRAAKLEAVKNKAQQDNEAKRAARKGAARRSKSILTQTYGASKQKQDNVNAARGSTTNFYQTPTNTIRPSQSAVRNTAVAHIANVSGGVEDVQKVLNTMTIGAFVKNASGKVTKNGTQTVSEFIFQNVQGKGFSQSVEEDLTKASIYASRLANAEGGQDSPEQLLDMIVDMKDLSEKYQNSGSEQEREVFANIMENLGIVEEGDVVKTIEDYEIGLKEAMLVSPDMYVGDDEFIGVWNKYEADVQMQAVDESAFSDTVKRYLDIAIESVYILRDSETGKYTASEILRAISQLRRIPSMLDGISDARERQEAQDKFASIMKTLRASLDEYEAHVRIMILNDPSSVDNNITLVDESKKYVRENYDEIPDILRGGLQYRKEDLVDGKDLRYARRQNNNQFITDEQRERMEQLKQADFDIQDANKRLEKLEKEQEELLNPKRLVRNAALDTVDIFKAALRSTAYVGSVGIGAMSAGMNMNSASGLQSGTQGFLTGKGLVDSTIKNTVGFVQDTWDDVKEGAEVTQELTDVVLERTDGTKLGKKLRDAQYGVEYVANRGAGAINRILEDEHKDTDKVPKTYERRTTENEYREKTVEKYNQSMEAKERDAKRWTAIYDLERFRKDWYYILNHNSFEGEDAETIERNINNINTTISALKAYRPYENDIEPEGRVAFFETELDHFKTSHGLKK